MSTWLASSLKVLLTKHPITKRHWYHKLRKIVIVNVKQWFHKEFQPTQPPLFFRHPSPLPPNLAFPLHLNQRNTGVSTTKTLKSCSLDTAIAQDNGVIGIDLKTAWKKEGQLGESLDSTSNNSITLAEELGKKNTFNAFTQEMQGHQTQ